MTYEEWIQNYLADIGSPFGKCQEASKKMKEAFPELVIARGHITDAFWGERGHWWLKDPQGEIVDPTASQFPGLISYREWTPGGAIQVGACMNCGNMRYRHVKTLDAPQESYEFDISDFDPYCDPPGEYIQDTFCSQACENETTAWFNQGVLLSKEHLG